MSGIVTDWVTVAQAAASVGMSGQAVRNLAKNGIVPAKKGSKSWEVSHDAVVRYFRGKAGGSTVGRPRKPPPPPSPKRGGYDGTPYDVSRAETEFWKARRSAMEFEKARGTLLDAGEVQAAYDDAAAAVRTKLLAIPSRVRQRIDLPAAAVTLIESLIRESLEELATDPHHKRAEEGDDVPT